MGPVEMRLKPDAQPHAAGFDNGVTQEFNGGRLDSWVEFIDDCPRGMERDPAKAEFPQGTEPLRSGAPALRPEGRE